MAGSLGSGGIHWIKGPILHFGTSPEEYARQIEVKDREAKKQKRLQKLKDEFEKEQSK